MWTNLEKPFDKLRANGEMRRNQTQQGPRNRLSRAAGAAAP